MAGGNLRKLVQQLRNTLRPRDEEAVGDGALLERYVQHRDEAAFAEVVRRHGPMVLGVCRRWLGQRPESDDAFQATFLVLARRAASIARPELLGNWLYGVACRVARRACVRADRHLVFTAEVPEVAAPEVDPEGRGELRQLLDEELDRLPAKYRQPVVLCYLEGQTNEQAGRILGWPAGTVKTRLGRARDLLRGRLARRGLALAPAGLAALLTPEAATAAVPAALAQATVQAALGVGMSGPATALVEGVLHDMLLTKLKVAGRLLTLGIALAGVGVAAYDRLADRPATNGVPGPQEAVRTDLYGDPLPPLALARLGSLRFRCDWGPTVIAFAPNGKVIAANDFDHAIQIWDAASGQRLLRLNVNDDRTEGGESGGRLAFAPDSQTLATANQRGVVTLWDCASGNRRREIVERPGGQFGSAAHPAFAPDGRTLATAGTDARLWDSATGRQLRDLGRHEGGPAPLAFAPDGRTLVTVCTRKGLRFWEVATGQVRLELTPAQFGNGTVSALAFTPDGKFLATAGASHDIRLWDSATGQEGRKLTGHTARVRGLVALPDSTTLASAAEDGTIRLWDLASGTQTTCLEARRAGQPTPLYSLALAPDGKTLAVGDGNALLRRWDVSSGQELLPKSGHSRDVTALVRTPDDRQLISAAEDGTIRFWDPASGQELRRLLPPPDTRLLALTPDGRTLLSAGGTTVCRWDVATGKELGRWQIAVTKITALACAPSGKQIAVGGLDFTIRLCDRESGKEQARYIGHQDPRTEQQRTLGTFGTFVQGVTSLCFTADGQTLLSGADDNVRAWDVASAKERRQFSGPKGAVHTLVLTPDGRTVLALGDEAKIHVLDLADGLERATVPLGGSGTSLALSPDGTRLAVAGWDGVVRLLDAAAGRELAALRGHLSRATAVVFSADGRSLASGSIDTTILVWNVRASSP